MSGRVIVQDTATRRYLGPESSWVESCQQARVFEHTYLALLEGLQHRDKILQVVWCFQNPVENLYIAVRPEHQGRIRPCEICKLGPGPRPMSLRAAA
jgi:hypothetical protein